jgi:hypothetical protein
VTFLTVLLFDKIHALFLGQLLKRFAVEYSPESTLQFAGLIKNVALNPLH